MLIFIENTPRAYAWGSRDALPGLLGTAPTGEPQAELWLGDHPGAPASVAKASPRAQTLIELIESDPERYGVDGKHLPFLLKVLGIGAPLSLQVHPDKQQALDGFAREQAAGVPLDARERNYGDDNHKPELLVALGEVSALCGFRALAEARADVLALAAASPEGPGRDALLHAAGLCVVAAGAPGATGAAGATNATNATGAAEGALGDADQARSSYLNWALSGDETVAAALQALGAALERFDAGDGAVDAATAASGGVAATRREALSKLLAAYPDDPGVLISLLLHLVTLQPGEAIYLAARQLHAYLDGIAVEVMAASDNVLRAGFTQKHVDVAEVLRVVDFAELDTPLIEPERLAPGLIAWAPEVPEFTLLRARLGETEGDDARDDDCAERVVVAAPYPMVLVVTSGRVRVERVGAEVDRAEPADLAGFAEVASVGKGQSLYVSSGEDIELSGLADVFLATVGASWPRVS